MNQQYNPKNPDAFRQAELPELEEPVPELNIIALFKGQSTIKEGDFSSKNFKKNQTGWRLRSDGSFDRAPIPRMFFSTVFETAARFSQNIGGSGAITFNTIGANLIPGVTGTSFAKLLLNIGGVADNGGLFNGNPKFSVQVDMTSLVVASGVGSSFFGIGNITANGGGHAFSEPHIGFKITKSGGVVTLYATQADDTIESASGALTTLVNDDSLDLIFEVNDKDNVSYFWRKNGGELSSAVVVSGRVPNSTLVVASTLQFSCSNDVTAFNFHITPSACSFER